MSKFQEPSDELVKLFNSIMATSNIPEFIEFKLFHCPSNKEPINITKANDLVKHLNNFEVILYFNEDLFDMLDDDLKKIALEEKLAQVFYDAEKDKLSMLKPDLSTFSGIINKYGKEYFRLFESVKAIKQQQEEKEKEAKAAAKESKGKK